MHVRFIFFSYACLILCMSLPPDLNSCLILCVPLMYAHVCLIHISPLTPSGPIHTKFNSNNLHHCYHACIYKLIVKNGMLCMNDVEIFILIYSILIIHPYMAFCFNQSLKIIVKYSEDHD